MGSGGQWWVCFCGGRGWVGSIFWVVVGDGVYFLDVVSGGGYILGGGG